MEKKVVVVEKSEAVRLMEDPNIARILEILRGGEMNAKQIHSRFNADYDNKKTLNSIYRYLSQMQKHGFVEISKEELKRKHMIVKYYVRTARFFVAGGEYKKKKFEEMVEVALDLLGSRYEIDRDDLERQFHEYYDFMIENIEECADAFLEIEKKHGWRKTIDASEFIDPIMFERETRGISKAASILKKSP